MTDRELLEAAAKAAGKDLTDFKWLEETSQFYWEGKPGSEGTTAFEVWGPLTDDGDALRLAVKLRIDLCVTPDEKSSAAWCAPASDFMEESFVGQDEMVATRRAIVRAAAEIGKGAAK